jgi:hypothetical protein
MASTTVNCTRRLTPALLLYDTASLVYDICLNAALLKARIMHTECLRMISWSFDDPQAKRDSWTVQPFKSTKHRTVGQTRIYIQWMAQVAHPILCQCILLSQKPVHCFNSLKRNRKYIYRCRFLCYKYHDCKLRGINASSEFFGIAH